MEQNRKVDLMDMWKIILKIKWTIIYSTLFFVVIADMVSFFFIKPVYESTVNLIIAKEEDINHYLNIPISIPNQ